MSTANVETHIYQLQWEIENITQCFWLKMPGEIASPAFVTDTLEGTKWTLHLFPSSHDEEGFLCFYLRREADCSGPDVVKIFFNFAFLGENGMVFELETQSTYFKKSECAGNIYFVKARKFLIDGREIFLSEDILTLQCTISRDENSTSKVKHLYSRTVFNVIRSSFVWRIDKLSDLDTSSTKNIIEPFLYFAFWFEREDVEKITIILKSSDECLKYFSFKAFIVDSDGKKEYIGSGKCFNFNVEKVVLVSITLPLTWREQNSPYFCNDALNLIWEFTYVLESNQSEVFCTEIISPETTKNDIITKQNHGDWRRKIQNMLPLIEDLKFLYNDGVFSDMKLRTPTKTFQVHKCILNARSPVFKRMFNNEMNSPHIEITDFEDDTVHQMLLYIYTECLVNLKLESASKLYEAANKYEIMPLKSKCSSFLKDNLSTTTACDILTLADRHQDKDLESAVKDYMLKHDEVFSSFEWKYFMDNNIKIAADILYRRLVVNAVKVYPSKA